MTRDVSLPSWLGLLGYPRHTYLPPGLAERLLIFLLHSHLAGSALVMVLQHNLGSFSKTVGKAYARWDLLESLSDTIAFWTHWCTFILSSATAEKCSATQKLARSFLYTNGRCDKKEKKFKVMYTVHQNGRTLHVMWLRIHKVEQFCFWWIKKRKGDVKGWGGGEWAPSQMCEMCSCWPLGRKNWKD